MSTLRPWPCRAGLCFFLMAAVTIGAWSLRPTPLLADEPPPSTPPSKPVVEWREIRRLAAAEAFQAAAADDQFVYAIDSARIVRYDRATGRRLAESRGEAKHLNSGFFHAGLLLCAHSNYPVVPERSQIKSLDPRTMELKTWRDFADFGGSLTWVVRHDDAWWCNFAHYGEHNAKSFVARFDDAWRETGRWNYPPELLKKFGAFSASGGVWLDGRLLVTGHDARELYELSLPREGRTLVFHSTHTAPFTGQGLALDLQSPREAPALVGIDRARRQIIFAQRDATKPGQALDEPDAPSRRRSP